MRKLYRIVLQKKSDIPEMLYCLHNHRDDGSSKHLRSVILLRRDCMTQYSRKLLSSDSLLWEPEISLFNSSKVSKVKSRDVPLPPCRHQGKEEVYSSYSFLTLALDGVSGQRHALAMLYPWERIPLLPYPLNRMLGGSQRWSGHRG
jgi:hypothetical protein